MDAGKITVSNITARPKVIKKKASGPRLPSDSFKHSAQVKSEPDAKKMMEMKTSAAAGVLFSGKSKADLIDPFGIKKEGFQVYSAILDPKTETWYAGLVKDGGKTAFLAAYNPDKSIKWKIPFEKPVYDMTPNKQGGVIIRQFAKIFSYDGKGKKNWEFTLPGGTSSFNEKPVVGKDGTVYYTTSKKESEEYKTNLSIVAVKDGKEKWTFDCGGFHNNRVGLEMGKDGNLYFTADEAVKPESLWDKFKNGSRRENFLISIDSDGKKRFAGQVSPSVYGYAMASASKDGGIVYADDNNMTLKSMNESGEEMWSLPLEERLSHKPVTDEDGNVYITTGDSISGHTTEYSSQVVCIDGKKGQVKWKKDLNKVLSSPPSLDGDNVYVRIYVPGNDEAFIKLSGQGKNLEQIGVKNSDGNALLYLENNKIMAGNSDNGYEIRDFDIQKSITEVNEKNFDDSSNTPDAEPEGITEDKDHVLIGGVMLEKRKKQN